jgi:CcmD family protein
MNYLIMAFTVTWVVYFAYLCYLDLKLRNVRRRLDARGM